jgi:hypothetical protein
VQSHGITLSFHREMADSSREFVGPDVTAAAVSFESYPRFIEGGFQDYGGLGHSRDRFYCGQCILRDVRSWQQAAQDQRSRFDALRYGLKTGRPNIFSWGSLVVPWAHLNDPSHWRARAIEARTMAERISDPISKEMMLKVAAEYEHLAKRAEERMAKDAPPSK